MKKYRKPNTIDFYLRDIGRILRYGIDERLKDYEITNPQGKLLGIIYGANKQGIEINRRYLEKKTGISGPSVTNLLGNLEKKGYIKRLPSDADGRALNISVTSEGEKVINEIHGIFQEMEASLVSDMSNEEKKTFKNLLKKAHTSIIQKF